MRTSLALLQPDDAEGEVVQLVGVHLEQLVTQGTTRAPPAAHAECASATNPDRSSTSAARSRSTGVSSTLSRTRTPREPDDPILSGDRSGLVEAADGHAGEPGRPMNRAAGIGTADGQQPALQRHRRIGMMRPRQETQTRAVLEEELTLCVDGVRRRAEQDEAPIDQPPEERRRHRDLSRDPRVAAVAVLELVGQRQGPLRHLRPVADRLVDVGEDRCEFALDRLTRDGVTAVDLDQRPCLDLTIVFGDGANPATLVPGDLDHRVDHEVDAELVPVEHEPDESTRKARRP